MDNQTYIGRFYDFVPPMDKIARNLVLTVFNGTLASIGFPGQIYCATCITNSGFFVSINNGSPSVGNQVDELGQFLPLNIFKILSTTHNANFDEFQHELLKLQTDFPLIVNVASGNGNFKSCEFSPVGQISQCYQPNDDPFISTNHFLNPFWNLSNPQFDSWLSSARRDNLIHQLNRCQQWQLTDLIDIMNLPFDKGGAKVGENLYRLIFNGDTFHLYLSNSDDDDDDDDHWLDIDLAGYFQ